LARETETAPDLAQIVDAWQLLPEAVKAGILALVRATVNATTSAAGEPTKRTKCTK
jgi:hypothetical protein